MSEVDDFLAAAMPRLTEAEIDGQWKIVHRHGDPLASKSAAQILERLPAP